jgi:hypothetical protein
MITLSQFEWFRNSFREFKVKPKNPGPALPKILGTGDILFYLGGFFFALKPFFIYLVSFT